MLELRDDHDIDLDQLEALRLDEGWAPLGTELLGAQVRGSRWVVSASRGPRLVGFCLYVAPGVQSFYDKLGFQVATHVMWRDRTTLTSPARTDTSA